MQKLYVLLSTGSFSSFQYILQNVAKTVRLQLSVSLRILSMFPSPAAFSCRFITSVENAILNLLCLEEFPPKMNPPIVQNIATIIFPLYPYSSSSSEVAPGN